MCITCVQEGESPKRGLWQRLPYCFSSPNLSCITSFVMMELDSKHFTSAASVMSVEGDGIPQDGDVFFLVLGSRHVVFSLLLVHGLQQHIWQDPGCAPAPLLVQSMQALASSRVLSQPSNHLYRASPQTLHSRVLTPSCWKVGSQDSGSVNWILLR